MDKTIPFFYYDIMSRIIPGAAALAVLSIIKSLPPISWLLSFTNQYARYGLQTDGQSWQTIAMPIVLLGLCYLIGTLYEIFDYWPPMKWLLGPSDDRMFLSVLEEDGEEGDRAIAKKGMKEIRRYKYALWEEITMKGSSEPAMSLVFAHCHRYQAEHKMFLHLIYPTLLFTVFSFANPYTFLNWKAILLGVCWVIIGLAVSAMFFYASQARDKRRWLQTLIFCRQLKLRDACVLRCFGPNNASDGREEFPD